jgi:uncharacterized protein
LATQIDLLAALQAIDQRLQQKEQTLEEFRQQVTAIVVEKENAQQEAETQRQRIDELERQRLSLEGQLKDDESKIKEKRVRLNRVRNERELLAMRREIDLMKEANGKLEEEALLLLEQIDQEKIRLGETHDRITTLQTRIEQVNAPVQIQITDLEEDLQRERNERETLMRTVDADLHARYKRIFAKRGGMAVVELRAGTCQGCYMRIPPHLCNQIRSSSLHPNPPLFHCPHCGRIVYSPEEVEDTSDT